MHPGQYNQGQVPLGQDAYGWSQSQTPQVYGQHPAKEQLVGMGGYPGDAYVQAGYSHANWAYQQQALQAQQTHAIGLTPLGMPLMQAGWDPEMPQPPHMQPAQMAPGHAQQPGNRAGITQYESLLEYLEDRNARDEFADLCVLQQLIHKGGPKACNAVSEEGFNPLHLFVMMGAATPEDAVACVRALVQGGACVNTKDPDGETPLDAALSIAEDSDDDHEDDENEYLKSGKPGKESRQLVRAACMKVLVQEPSLEIDEARLQRICAFARKHQPSDREDELLAAVKRRVDLRAFNRVWESEELLAYLQDCCYDTNCGADPAIVAGHLQRGAGANYRPTDGLGALHLVALNPHHKYSQVREVTRLLVESDPKCAEVRDAFKLTALQWAQDYINLARQHNLKYPSLATLLAFAELLPEGLDSGLVCISIGSMKYMPVKAEKIQQRPSLRFAEGDRVKALVAVPGGKPAWEEGVVVGLWLKNAFFPKKHHGCPYEVLLDLGTRVLCLHDRPDLIRAENDKATAADAPKSTAKRFAKRKRPDGKWEIVDSKTGNAKLIPTPDSSDAD